MSIVLVQVFRIIVEAIVDTVTRIATGTPQTASEAVAVSWYRRMLNKLLDLCTRRELVS